MKKLAILLSLALTLTIAGCGGSSSASSAKESAPAPVEETESNETAPATETQADEAKESTEAASDTAASEQAPSAEKPGKETIEEQVILDEGGVTITAKSLDKGGTFGPQLKLLIENNSGSNLTVQAKNVSVNGYMIEPMLSADVADGKKTNDTLTFMSADIKAASIETIADMEFSFHIFDSASWDTYLDTSPIKVTTSAADGFDYSFDDSGTPVYEENDIRIIVKGRSKNDSFLGPGIILYIENNTDTDYTVQTRDVSINGFMVDPIFSCDIVAGKHAIDSITFSSTELAENDIEDITDVELSFHIFDMDSWETTIDTDVIAMHFNN